MTFNNFDTNKSSFYDTVKIQEFEKKLNNMKMQLKMFDEKEKQLLKNKFGQST